MKIKLVHIIFVTVLLWSCSKSNKKEDINKVFPMSYYLSEKDKALFNFYYSNKIIKFQNSATELLFKADSIYTINTRKSINELDGEQLFIRYNCQTSYFPNYSLNLRLTATSYNEPELEVMFGTGTYWGDRGNDYVLSSFRFQPLRTYPFDTTTYLHGNPIKYSFTDSLKIDNIVFYKVFRREHSLINTDVKQTKVCYYTNNMGVIAFHNNDGKLWVRKN